ncbi:MAG: Na/Pi cotransporter family protein [Magnetococcales bacterium]|nr:Na/Pi cotransporter family protein [Magnetococcales bacterium]
MNTLQPSPFEAFSPPARSRRGRWRWLLGGALLFCLAVLFAAWPGAGHAGNGASGIDFGMLTMRLFGGLAIFLYGMEKMSDALKLVAGDRMKSILGALTTNRVMGLITGAFVTSVIQSSSVTTVMLVGFVTAGLMNLTQAVGVILGADIGTTITAQIVAFKVTKYASLLITSGFVITMVCKRESHIQTGHLILGLGLIFFGMGEMSTAMHPLRSYEPFIETMQNVSNPFIGILVATAFTGLVQSSSATMGVVVVLATQGLITLEGGIALALGANIGTCVTAGLAAIGKTRDAIRVAVAHVTFKVVGVLLIVWFIPAFAEMVRSLSPVADPGITNAQEILAAEVPRQVANAHTLFNVGIAFAFLPLTSLFVRFCEWVVPAGEESTEKSDGDSAVYRPKYLDDSLLSTPAFALGLVRRELNAMADTVEYMLTHSLKAVIKGDMKTMDHLCRLDDRVDAIYRELTRYLSRMGQRNLPQEVADEILATTSVLIELEHIGDVIENNFHHLAENRIDEGIELTERERVLLENYHESILWAFRSATTAYISDNGQAASMVLGIKEEIMGLDATLRNRQILALQKQGSFKEGGEFPAYTLHMDLRENLKRIFYYIKRIAKAEAHIQARTKAARIEDSDRTRTDRQRQERFKKMDTTNILPST